MSLTCEHLHFAYRPGRPVLNDITLSAAPGTILTLLGPNGSGKTTLMRLLTGSLTPSEGAVRLDGLTVTSMRAHERALRIAYVPQQPQVAFAYTLGAYIRMGRHALGRGEAAVYADEAMKLLDLAHLVDEPVPTLSAGQRHRAAIARAVCQLLGDRPKGCTRVLLADEPLAALDPRHALMVGELFRELAHRGVLVVLVLHDLALGARLSDSVVLLSGEGRVLCQGSPERVMEDETLRGAFGVGFRRLEMDGTLAALIPQSGGTL